MKLLRRFVRWLCWRSFAERRAEVRAERVRRARENILLDPMRYLYEAGKQYNGE